MAIDKFKQVDIVIDNINRTIKKDYELTAMSGEYNGRVLKIQVTNNGIIEQQNCTLIFGFEFNEDLNLKGVYDVRAVDRSQGLFEVAYPSKMLQRPGFYTCALKVIDSHNNSVSITHNFSVEVVKSVFRAGMEVAENSIRVFDKAILDIAVQERRINLIETNLQTLTTMLNRNIPNMDVAVSTRADQASVNAIKSRTDSYLNTSISSRAPANTALSTSVWTSNLANALTNKLKPRVQKHISSSSFTSNTLTNVLNITGAGFLKSVRISSATNSNSSIQLEAKIMIDGRTLFYLGGSYGVSFSLTTVAVTNISSVENLIYPSTSKQNLPYVDRGVSKSAIFAEPIFFNNSLQIYIQHKVPYSSYYGSYAIDYEVVI